MTTVDKITFQQTFPTGNFSNNKLGVEMSLVAGVDDPIEAFEQAKKIVNEAFEKLNPQINCNDKDTWLAPRQEAHIITSQPTERPIGVTIDDINSCTDKKILETYKFLIKGKPELEAAYLAKLKTFIK